MLDSSHSSTESDDSRSMSNGRQEDTTERSPLLPSDNGTRNAPQQPPMSESWQTPERITLLVMVVVLLVSLGDQWMETPQARIMESVICYRYYEETDPSKLLLGRDRVGPGAIGGVEEMYCKADEVQSELAMLRGRQQLFDGFPGLLLALPFGWAADRFGRKPLLLVGILAFILRASWIQLVTWFWQAFDIRVTWLSTVFASLGGGNAMTVTLLFVVLSDITPEAQRAGVFLRAGAFNLLANLVMPPLAAWLMTYDPWIPNLGGTLLMIISAALFIFCPETLDFNQSPSDRESYSGLPTEDAEAAPPPDLLPNGGWVSLDLARHWLTKFQRSTAFLTNDWRVPLLILPFIVHMLLGASGQLLLQYLSKRYGLTFSKATLLMTIRSGVVVLLLFVILPYVSTAVMRIFQLSAQRKDLYLARTSQVFVTLGWTLVGLSPNIPSIAVSLAVASLGQGMALLLRSFLTSLVPPHNIARVYSIISIVDTIGMMFGSPLLAGLFKRGLALGGAWVGLPFYFTGLVSLLFLLLLFSVGLRKGEDESTSDEDE